MEKTGGVCMDALVVEKLASGFEDEGFKAIPMPLDISNLDIDFIINIFIDRNLGGYYKSEDYKMGSIMISVPKTVPIVSVSHGINSFVLVRDPNIDESYLIDDCGLTGAWVENLYSVGTMDVRRFCEGVYFVADNLSWNGVGDIPSFTNLEYGDKIVDAGPNIYVAAMQFPGDTFFYDFLMRLETPNSLVPVFVRANG
jgi:hypothetical protein